MTKRTAQAPEFLNYIPATVHAQLRAMGLKATYEPAGSRAVTVACDGRIFQVWAQPR